MLDASSAENTLPLSAFDPTDPDLRSDPYPWYRALRSEAPVFNLPGTSIFFLSRYDDVKRALTDRLTYSFGTQTTGVSLPSLDGCDLTGLRKAMMPELSAEFVSELRDEVKTTARLLAADIDGSFDAVAALGERLSLTTTCRLLGLPLERLAEIQEGCRHFLNMLAPTSMPHDEWKQSSEGTKKLLQLLEDASRRRAATAMLGNLHEGASSNEANNAVWRMAVLLIAGFETTASAISSCCLVLAQRPELFRRIKADRELVSPLVAECLRFLSPLQRRHRDVLSDTTLHSQLIPSGSQVVVLIGSANRDERRFEAPDRFDIERDTTGHLGFGAGAHFCPASRLGTLQAEQAIGALVDRIDTLEIAGTPHAIVEDGRGGRGTFFGWREMPLVGAPGRGG